MRICPLWRLNVPGNAECCIPVSAANAMLSAVSCRASWMRLPKVNYREWRRSLRFYGFEGDASTLCLDSF